MIESEGDVIRVIGFLTTMLVIFAGVYIYGDYQKQVQQSNHVAYCVGSYTGENENRRDWVELLKSNNQTIADKTGIKKAVIDDCIR